MTPYALSIAQRLRPEAQATFAYEYQRYSKDPNLALVLTIVLGIVGGESYYMGNYVRGILMSIALFTGIGVFVTIPMWIVRCFTIVGECETYNDYVAYALALRYGAYDEQTAEFPPAPPPAPPSQARRRPTIGGLPMPVRSL
ncbi:MAG: TM2 domain-containing protein [Candidatus Eremiobacteraeota bacterium]|nr:TM2 domain-containing protein [Candidatus Eremiobacteraeota bacterium]MBV8285057.1 TM2 domain-containing protein [Candidatus Eremiobacteraeota bacterium]MBV8333715.1 TM2 domain-containing protein [Candidatus Eremiobacteraeota bacterium]MBV8435201.1 TM2 domain-containing protein [Candidatus Eremiobacteraeota bacterium]MBV8584513.1 TM2 domain-containing protein [Candidatus Eremiobacteraeota bacterium]